MNSLSELQPRQRAARYREMAREMRSRAAAARSKEIRSQYVKIAVQWLDMAEKLDAELGKVSVMVESALASLLWKDPG